jgi:hypothetical protein
MTRDVETRVINFIMNAVIYWAQFVITVLIIIGRVVWKVGKVWRQNRQFWFWSRLGQVQELTRFWWHPRSRRLVVGFFSGKKHQQDINFVFFIVAKHMCKYLFIYVPVDVWSGWIKGWAQHSSLKMSKLLCLSFLLLIDPRLVPHSRTFLNFCLCHVFLICFLSVSTV